MKVPPLYFTDESVRHTYSSSAYNVMEGSLLTGKVLRIQRSGFVSVDVGFRRCAARIMIVARPVRV